MGRNFLRWLRLIFAALCAVPMAVAATETTTFAYDALGRLVTATRSGTVNNGVITSTSYDAASNRASYTITGGKVAPTLSISTASGLEGRPLTFTVTRSGDVAVAVNVNWRTADSTATAGSDYTAAAGTLTFASGDVSKTIEIATIDDNGVENPETLSVTLSAASAPAGMANTTATGTIADNDATLAISGPSALEGSGLAFTVTRTGYKGAAATVNFATTNASATAPDDYVSASGTLTFEVGETAKTVTIQTADDNRVESSETLGLILSGPSAGLVPGTLSGTGTVLDNDSAYAIAGATVVEGGILAFTVTRSGYTEAGSTVGFATANGTAAAVSDFSALSGTLNFAARQDRARIEVTTIDDSIIETTEALEVRLSSPTAGATIATDRATGTIVDNDLAFAIGNAATDEGGVLTFTVTRQGGTAAAGSVDFATADGTATAGGDYTAARGTLKFAAGEASAAIRIATGDDGALEPTETMVVNLSGAAGGASITAAKGTGMITDNDSAFVIGNASVLESGILTFVVTRRGSTAARASVDFATASGTAVAGADFVSSSGTLSFGAGQTMAAIKVATVNDSTQEAAEIMTVNLSGATGGAAIASATATGTISDNDSVLSITGASAAEGGMLVFTVSRSGYSENDVAVGFASANGTARAGSDYTPVAGRLGFAAGQKSATIVVPTIDETLFEGDESLSVDLAAPSLNAALGAASAVGTILNNDARPPNQPPVANADSVTVGVCRGTWVDVVANDTDPEGEGPLVLLSVTGSGLATVSVNTASNLVRVQAYGGVGGEFVTYTVRDSKGATSQGLLAINVIDGTGCN